MFLTKFVIFTELIITVILLDIFIISNYLRLSTVLWMISEKITYIFFAIKLRNVNIGIKIWNAYVWRGFSILNPLVINPNIICCIFKLLIWGTAVYTSSSHKAQNWQYLFIYYQFRNKCKYFQHVINTNILLLQIYTIISKKVILVRN